MIYQVSVKIKIKCQPFWARSGAQVPFCCWSHGRSYDKTNLGFIGSGAGKHSSKRKYVKKIRCSFQEAASVWEKRDEHRHWQATPSPFHLGPSEGSKERGEGKQTRKARPTVTRGVTDSTAAGLGEPRSPRLCVSETSRAAGVRESTNSHSRADTDVRVRAPLPGRQVSQDCPMSEQEGLAG